MTAHTTAWAWDQYDVPAGSKLVLLSLAMHASYENGRCYLKIETIMRETGLGRAAVYSHLGQLKRNEYIHVVSHNITGRHRANDYYLRLDRKREPWVKFKGSLDTVPVADDGPMCDADATAENTNEATFPNNGPHTITNEATFPNNGPHTITEIAAVTTEPAVAGGRGESKYQTGIVQNLDSPPPLYDSFEGEQEREELSPERIASTRGPHNRVPTVHNPGVRPRPQGAFDRSKPLAGYDPQAAAAEQARRQAQVEASRSTAVFVLRGSEPGNYWLAYKRATVDRNWYFFETFQGNVGTWCRTLYPPPLPDGSVVTAKMAADAAAQRRHA